MATNPNADTCSSGKNYTNSFTTNIPQTGEKEDVSYYQTDHKASESRTNLRHSSKLL